MADVTAPLYWNESPKGLRKIAVSNRSGVAVATLGLSVFLLFALGILISVNLATLRERFAWTQHTEETLAQIGTVQQNLLRLESNMRAYALTADPRHISRWENLAADTRGRLSKLAALVSDNPEQTRNLAMLRPKVEERVTRWAQLADRGISSNNATITQDMRNELARDVVGHPMGKLAAQLSGFRGVETRLLRERQLLADRQTVLLTYLSFLIVLAAPAFGAIGLVMLLRDRHHLRNRELHLQLEHTQRLNLMGETASTLAHELKQPLTSTNNYLAVLKKIFEKSGAEQELSIAEKMSDQLARANGIIQRLRNFIENRTVERQLEDPATLVEDAVALLGILDTHYRLRTELEPDLPDIPVDRVQIQQVLVNLMRNAVEAMEKSARKELSLSVGHAQPGMVEFRLRDSGPGLSGRIRGRIFEPFNSTKADGMGVGLSICKRIIQDHGGRIWVEDAPGGGAIFGFALPIQPL